MNDPRRFHYKIPEKKMLQLREDFTKTQMPEPVLPFRTE